MIDPDPVARDPGSLDAAESRVCAVLRGTPGVWRELADPADATAVLAAAARHRVRPLLSWHVRAQGELGSWPEPVRASLVQAERAEAALEIVRRLELARLFRAFATAGVEAVLFKGAAFAYGLYPEPWLRPREDTDVILRFSDAAAAGRVLTDAGFERLRMTSGEIVTHQRTYLRTDRSGLRHEWDVHWKIANPVAVADLVPADDLIRAAVPLHLADGTTVRIPERVHALVLSCLHRVSHHHDSGDLLWLYDIHLLAGRLTPAEARALVEMSRRIGVGGVCARGLRLARARFGPALPSSLLEELEAPTNGAPALSADYLGPRAAKIEYLRADLAAIHGWPRRWRLLREHVFPPGEYMLARYGRSSRLFVPVLYAWRILSGARGWFRPPD